MAAKTKDRHHISITGLSYQRVETYASPRKLPISGLLEVWIHDRLDREGQPLVRRKKEEE